MSMLCAHDCVPTHYHIVWRDKIYRIKKAIGFQTPRAFVRTHRRALVVLSVPIREGIARYLRNRFVSVNRNHHSCMSGKRYNARCLITSRRASVITVQRN